MGFGNSSERGRFYRPQRAANINASLVITRCERRPLAPGESERRIHAAAAPGCLALPPEGGVLRSGFGLWKLVSESFVIGLLVFVGWRPVRPPADCFIARTQPIIDSLRERVGFDQIGLVKSTLAASSCHCPMRSLLKDGGWCRERARNLQARS